MTAFHLCGLEAGIAARMHGILMPVIVVKSLKLLHGGVRFRAALLVWVTDVSSERKEKSRITIVTSLGTASWPHVVCEVRGDLGCLREYAQAAGYRAKDLAHSLSIDERAFRREIKSVLGISLKNWLVQMRSVEVRHRLQGFESIEEIALSVGFSHSKELSREFRKIYGVTPSEYRKRHKQTV